MTWWLKKANSALLALIRLHCGGKALEWHVCMFFPWHMRFLGRQQFQVLANSSPSGGGFNDVVHVASHRSWERIPKLLNILLLLSCRALSSKDDGHGSLGAHHSHLGCRPGIVGVALQVLRRHHVIGASVCFPCDDGYLRNSCLSICIQQLCPVSDDTTIFLSSAWQESRDILKCYNGDVESVTESDETCSFHAGIDVQAPRGVLRVVPHNPHGPPVHPSKPGHNILGIQRHHLKELPLVDNPLDHFQHVIGRC